MNRQMVRGHRPARAWTLARLKRHSGVRYGVPFLGFILAGYYGLATFVESKVERGDAQIKKQSEREYSMQEEHAVIMRQLNIDDLVIKPVPKPPKAFDEDDDDEEEEE